MSGDLLLPNTPALQSSITPNLYLYCGEQFDPDLGLYFLRARYMDTDRGRFWTMDTFEGTNHDPASLHKYLYVHGDPVNAVDPLGQFKLTELQIVQLIGAMVGMVSGVTATRIITPDADWSDYILAIAVGGVSGAVGITHPSLAAGGGAFLASYVGARKKGCDQSDALAVGLCAGAIASAAAYGGGFVLAKLIEAIGAGAIAEYIVAPVSLGTGIGVGVGAFDQLAQLFCGQLPRRDLFKQLENM